MNFKFIQLRINKTAIDKSLISFFNQNPVGSFLKNRLEKLADLRGSNPGTVIKFAGCLTWASSSAAQVIAIITNDKIPAKDKKFMIRQELADGAINVATLLALSSAFEAAGRRIVKCGLILPEKALNSSKLDSIEKKSSEVLSSLKNKDLSKPEAINMLPESIKNFVKGMSAITAIGGQLFTVSLAAPILRNQIAHMTDGYKKMPDIHNKEVSMFVDKQFKTFQNSVKIPQSIRKPLGTLNINFNKPGMKI